MRKIAATATAIVILAGSAVAGAANNTQAWQWNYKKWMPAVWIRLAHCESGTRPWYAPPRNNPKWTFNSGTYQGAFGFYHGSWDDYRYPGYPREAYDATPWQQYRVALRIHKKYGFTGWGCYKHSWVRYGYGH